MADLYGTEVASGVKRSQVYQATHRGDDSRLPFMNRSFISFSYGGKNIEDFDLIATITGDRINHPAYASFEDTVTTYDDLDGQQYWATHYKTNQLDFTLSTDGIDQKQLDNFLYWFKAGITRELVLAEHPNRAILARVSQPPTINLLPFEHDVNIVISGETYQTKTTLYKGDIQLSLVMDSPHWYSIVNILGKIVESEGRRRYEDKWTDTTTDPPSEVSIFASKDALKILYEDGIPLGSMIATSMLLGNGAYANIDNQVISCIWDKLQNAEDFNEGQGAKIDNGNGRNGIIAGAIVNANDEGIETLSAGQQAYFFYSGTAPAYTVITFTLIPTFSNNYISTPGNSYATSGEQAYNTITIKSETTQTLRFTTPNIFSSYNKAIQIMKTMVNSSYTWENVRQTIREQVFHSKVREYAISVIDAQSSSSINNSSSTVQTNMKKFFVGSGSNAQPVTFEFNSETGEAVGTFSYYSDGSTLSQNQKEDVGDMLRSNYIILQDRNYPTSSGKIVGWQDNEEGRRYSHCIMHDVNGGLTNLQILYKNMYL